MCAKTQTASVNSLRTPNSGPRKPVAPSLRIILASDLQGMLYPMNWNAPGG